ncbi:hypothetical protein NZD89_26750 [Alicyclobacillus fastidiosus]|uniref:DUF5667 domain-containing protein n=1 Tax=Alicyclobacillus fastidiosus TaxID=392011 RepID=A0ABY6ZFX7_9BACL|nr:hypothetical protein [Alicyclobacillus fastidiosus]WAH41762.1 hypothetical protein NZD89_26750 [Alicyclobacillus fastidiosus]GMA63454.1 hypothetical protein GCM10025859_38940 [Alicyclobacillus fastidiosus]
MNMKRQKFAKGLIAGALIFGVSAAGGTVWAATDGTVTVTSVPTNTTSTAASETTNNTTTGTTNSSTSAKTSQTDLSKQLSSDYSKFIKTIYQQIEDAIKTKNITKAQQLAQFANEQISKANSLVQQGQTQEAVDALSTALASATAAQSGSDSSSASAILGNLPHNALALAAGLQHVHNLQAQQSLEKNISKEFAHLAEQLQKLASMQQQQAEKSTQAQGQTQASTGSTAATSSTSGAGQVSVKASAPSTSSTAKKPCSESKVKAEAQDNAWKSAEKVKTVAFHVAHPVGKLPAHKGGDHQRGQAEHGDHHVTNGHQNGHFGG